MKISETSIAVSTRIRLARNFDNYFFPSVIRGTDAERKIVAIVSDLFNRFGGYKTIKMSDLSCDEKSSLIERYLISQNLAASQLGAVILSSDKCVSVMVNEEDHLRLQCIISGFDFDEARRRILPVDNLLNRNFRFAKDGNFYYTACPSNLGSGMRASVMTFLPALSYTGAIDYIMDKAKKTGITFRGAFGEGSSAEGYWYQVSNSRTMQKPEEIIDNVSKFVVSVVSDENDERYHLYGENKNEIEDECLRAYGILGHCRLLSYDECVNLIAKVKLGNSLGFLPLKNPRALDDLLVSCRPATLKIFQKDAGNELVLRANYVSDALKII
jgi:protein arginine kinase